MLEVAAIGSAAWLGLFVATVRPLIAMLSIHGTVPSGPGSLAGLLPAIEERLRDEVHRLRSLSLILINIDDS